MYITRFTTTDGQVEDYFYRNVTDAADHLSLFKTDDSGLYDTIAVLNDATNTVIAILTFDNGIPGDLFTVGSKVRLRDEYSTPEERKYIYEVSNLNENTGRAVIVCTNSSMAIASAEMVGLEMISLIK